MKKVIFVLAVVFAVGISQANAQYVRVKPGFSVGIHVGPQGVAPHRGDVWIAPEWRWEGGRYIEVPGHWETPGRYGAVWIPGHWKYTRRHGYIWIPGHWR